MINKKFDEIKYEDLIYLIQNQILEGKDIEYKSELPGNSDQDKKEFLADVSSFCNTNGGDLIYGITENDGIPTEVIGFNIESIDESLRRLDSIIQAGIKPRFLYHLKFIQIDNSDKKILVIRIEKSWNSPHQIVFNNDSKFHARNSAGKYQLDLAELRSLFNYSQNLQDEIKSFINNRVLQIEGNNMPILFNGIAKIVLHLIPLETFKEHFKIDIESIERNPLLRPIYASTYNTHINFDGRLFYSKDSSNNAYTYTQVYRNGVIEAVDAGMLANDDEESENRIASIAYEKTLIESVNRYIKFYNDQGFNAPIALSLCLLNVKGYKMSTSGFSYRTKLIDRDMLFLPNVLVEALDTPAEKILKPLFDLIWNACGYPKSENFDSNGNWVTR
jgi:hypothetical protein